MGGEHQEEDLEAMAADEASLFAALDNGNEDFAEEVVKKILKGPEIGLERLRNIITGDDHSEQLREKAAKLLVKVKKSAKEGRPESSIKVISRQKEGSSIKIKSRKKSN